MRGNAEGGEGRGEGGWTMGHIVEIRRAENGKGEASVWHVILGTTCLC